MSSTAGDDHRPLTSRICSRLVMRSWSCFRRSGVRTESIAVESRFFSDLAALRCVPTSATRGLASGCALDARKRSQYRSWECCSAGGSHRLHSTTKTPAAVSMNMPCGTQYSVCPAKSQTVQSPAPGIVAGNASKPCVREFRGRRSDDSVLASSVRCSASASVDLPTSPFPHRKSLTRSSGTCTSSFRRSSALSITARVSGDASCRGPLESLFLVDGSAPLRTSSRTTSLWPPRTAKCSAVSFMGPIVALMEAVPLIAVLTAPRLPIAAAKQSSSVSRGTSKLTSPYGAKILFTISLRPDTRAIWSAVRPALFFADISEPCSRSFSTTVGLAFNTAW
eukprot:m.115391 g.115391  ORF g.115391 m.115391 type:complete len:337 (+) comp21562_c0_seq6:3488-4498(+)